MSIINDIVETQEVVEEVVDAVVEEG